MNYNHEGNTYSDLGSFIETVIQQHDHIDIAEDIYTTADDVDRYIRQMDAIMEGGR